MNITELPEEIKKAICTVKVTLNKNDKKEKHELYIENDLDINYENIEHDMETLPHIYYMWAMLYSEVREQKEVIEKKIRRRKGIIYQEIIADGGKDLRRSDITDIMESDEVLDNLEIQLILISKQSQKLWYILESLRMKNDNVRSLSGFKKQEMYQSTQSAI